jgi:poly(A) polymerase
LIDSGLATAIFDIYKGDSVIFGRRVLEHLPQAVDFPLSMAAFWAGIETKTALDQCKKLKLSNDHLKHIRFLLQKRDVLLDAEMPISKLKLLMHEPYFWDLLSLQNAIQGAKGESDQRLKQIRKRATDIDEKDVRPQPLLNGHELMSLGATPGPMVGQLSQEMYIAQLESHLKTKAQAKEWCQEWLGRHKSS